MRTKVLNEHLEIFLYQDMRNKLNMSSLDQTLNRPFKIQ